MSELKLACPSCGQHIACDSAYSGAEIDCPTCAAKMTVPAALESTTVEPEESHQDTCPTCGAPAHPNDVICTGCGFNHQTGKEFKTHSAQAATGEGITAMYTQLQSTATEIHSLPEFQKKRPGRLSGFKAFFIRAGRAIGLIFTEKELIVFGLLQWAVIGIVYYIWVQVLGWIPEETWADARKDDGISMVEIMFALWSLLCIGLAAFPLGILSGCMGAAHFLNRQGQDSTIAGCMKIVMPHSFRLWIFHWIDAAYTCHQILERLPKKRGENEPRKNRALSEALYYAWKLGTAGIMPGLVMGKGLIGASKDSVLLVKDRFFDMALLRVGYSGLCWVIGVLAYVGSVYFFWATGFFDKTEGLSEGMQILGFFKLAGIPLLVAVGVVVVFLRPLFVISLCEIYSEQMEARGEQMEFSKPPGRGAAALVAFGIVAALLIVGAIYLKPFLADHVSANQTTATQIVSESNLSQESLKILEIHASSEMPGDIDGMPQTAERLLEHDSLNGFWNSAERVADATITMTLGREQPVGRATIRWKFQEGATGARAMKYAISTSLDQKNWNTVYNHNENNANRAEDDVSFTPRRARFVRLHMTHSSYGRGNPPIAYFTAHWIKLYGISTKPLESETATASATGNRSLNLNGEGSYFELPANAFNNLNEATIECWVKWDSFQNSSRVFDFVIGTQLVAVLNCENTATLWAETFISGRRRSLQVPGVLRLNHWTHIALVSGRNQFALYVDGNLVQRGSIDEADTFRSSEFSRSNLLGRSNAKRVWPDDQDLDGQLNDVRVWNRIRTPDEIKAGMNSKMTGNEPGLVGFWNFDDPANPGRDLSPGNHHGKLSGKASVTSGSHLEQL